VTEPAFEPSSSSAPEAHPQQGSEPDGDHRGPTVRDRRRIDPNTYQVREPQPAAAPGSAGADEAAPAEQGESEVSELKAALAERTSDLQRLQAEYVNYKRRVDRDRDLARRVGIEAVLKDLLSVLDDLRSAREHGELAGAFKAVGDEVERIAGKYGLIPFGEKGDPFDPHIHEALLHAHTGDVEGPTCVEILQPGYKVGDKVLRPARVAVAEPEPDLGPENVEEGASTSSARIDIDDMRPEPPSTSSAHIDTDDMRPEPPSTSSAHKESEAQTADSDRIDE
jgi:molecular chaperone GrpE